MLSHFFIRRPIFAIVISLVIVIAGLVSQGSLPVAEYPEVAPPTVKVTAVYPGANAKVVAETVAAPIEQEVNGVEDMLYMSSNSADDGSYSLTVTFDIGSDMDMVQVLVQNRVSIVPTFFVLFSSLSQFMGRSTTNTLADGKIPPPTSTPATKDHWSD